MTRSRLARTAAAAVAVAALGVLPACAVPCDDAAGDTSTAVLADDDCGEDDD